MKKVIIHIHMLNIQNFTSALCNSRNLTMRESAITRKWSFSPLERLPLEHLSPSHQNSLRQGLDLIQQAITIVVIFPL